MIDIVIPVFNAYRHVRACVDSVLLHTDLSTACLYLIDDASTDPRISAWLALLAQQHPEIHILRNSQNLGFVHTVNRGMQQSGNDVVLLNSDTIVSAGWLQKLQACAWSRANVATVTPFSNNAEICSYPVFCRNTRIEGLDTRSLAAALETAFDGTYPEIPTAVGFCMLIRRQVLNDIGLFDAERFGKGYGEENDFCWRARNADWVHLLCTNTWVSHLGGQSFTEQTGALKQLHLERLLALHPDYNDRIAEFIASDPVAPYRQRIIDALASKGLDELGRPHRAGVLLVTHGMGGGVEKHVQDLAQLLDPEVRVEILRPRSASTVLLCDTLGNEYIISAEPSAFCDAMRTRGYRRLHIHHLHGYPQRCAEALYALGVPVDVTLHDFGYWCPQYNLSLANGRYCGEPGPEQCAQCLAQRPHPWGTTITQWRETQHRWLSLADRVIAPSEFIAERIQHSWPELKVLHWAHPPRHEWLGHPPRTLRVGIPGGLSAGKGLDEVVQCASFVAVRNLPVEFIIIGYTARGIPRWPDLPVRITGEYDDADLPGLLQSLSLDCLWLSSVIPESYSYTLDAAFQTGLPLIAHKASGALAGRLASGTSRHALLDSQFDPFEFVRVLAQLLGVEVDAMDGVDENDAQRLAEREDYKRRLPDPVVESAARGDAAAAVRALALMPSCVTPSVGQAAQEMSLPLLLEQALDCGHRPSLLVLRSRVLELDEQLHALTELERREGKPWHEYLDALLAERAGLYAERALMLEKVDAQADQISQWTLHARELASRVQLLEQQQKGLVELEAREAKPWYEYLDALLAERAGLYAERALMLEKVDAQADQIGQWTLHAEGLSQRLEAEVARHAGTESERVNATEGLEQARASLEQVRLSLESARVTLHNQKAQIQQLSASLKWIERWYVVREVTVALKILKVAESTVTRKLLAARRIGSVLLRGVRRWPVALSVLRHEGPGALLRRVRQKLWPAEPATDWSPQRPTATAVPMDSAQLQASSLELGTVARDVVPRVSIIVPVYGQHGYTLQCLQSLAAHTDLADVEVIVIDDASPEAAQIALSGVAGVRWMRNAENHGFLRTCNRAAQAALGEFLILLNNDVQVTPGWLPALLSVFELRPDAGLVGAQLLYPDGRLQEAGGIVWKDGSAWNWGRLQDPQHPGYQYLRPADYCSGACLAIRSGTWRELKGFDPIYVPAYYEDTDLAFRVRKAGLQVYYQPACRVVHHEGISSGTDETQGIKRHQNLNQATFFRRWQQDLAHHQANGTDPLREVTRWARKRMLIVEACMITPDQDSGSVRMLSMLRILTSLGVQVSFIADNLEGREPYASQLRADGIEVWHSPHVQSVAQLLRERGSLFDVVMLCRHYIAAPLLPAVRQHAPQAEVWFDTVDLHYLREERLAALENSSALARTAAQTRAQEIAVIEASDLTVVVSPVEQAVLARQAPAARVEIVSNIHDVRVGTPGFGSRSGLLFVGGFQHPPNVDAVQWFVHEVWPLIREQAPDMVVRIVGSKMPEKLRELQGNGVEILGFVQDIEPLLDSSRLSIAPLRYGAGVKGKVNQAMAYGLPVVATSVAVEGMGLTVGEHVLVGDTPQQFADAVLQAHDSQVQWETLASGGRRNIEEVFSSTVARRVLRKLLFSLEM